MSRRVFSHVRENVVAYLALFFALSGVAVAAPQFIKVGDQAGGDLTGTYPNPQIAPGAVTTTELANGAVTSTKFDSAAKAPDADLLDGKNSTEFTEMLTATGSSSAFGLAPVDVTDSVPVAAGSSYIASGRVHLVNHSPDPRRVGCFFVDDEIIARSDLVTLPPGFSIPLIINLTASQVDTDGGAVRLQCEADEPADISARGELVLTVGQ